MNKFLTAAALAAMIASPALAQVVETPNGTAVVVRPGVPGTVAPQPGSTGDAAVLNYSPTGQPADTVTNDSAAGGNAGQPSRVAPQGGGGGR